MLHLGRFPNNIFSLTLKHIFIFFFSRLGDCYTQARLIHFPLRRTLSVRPWHRLPGDYRYMRTVAREELRFSQNLANQEHAPDCVRITGSRSRNLRQYRRHSEIVPVNNIKYIREICQDIEVHARCGL